MTDRLQPSSSERKPTREEIALVEVGHTSIARSTAWAMITVFLAVIAAVPLVDGFIQARAGGLAAVHAFDLLRDPPRIADFTMPVHHEQTAEANPLHAFERSLEDASSISSAVQPRIQSLLTGWLRTGNSKVVLGADDWLFYRPGVDYPAYPGFLGGSQHQILRRQHPDPRPAMLRLHQDCRNAGVRLMLVPIADKAQIHSKQLSSRFTAGAAVENPDFPAWLDGLRAAGVEVLPTAQLLRDHASLEPAFLRQDSHWTPAAMEAVAKAIVHQLALPVRADRRWRAGAQEVSRLGDLVDTLKLAPGQTLYRPQAVTIHPVVDASDGTPWSASPTAGILLLGDSFTNIYSEPRMGWGTAAGLAPQLALRLGRDLDVIAINGGGATLVRQELAHRADPLGGKEVIVWAFSARDLAVADWGVIPLIIRREAGRPAAQGEHVLDLEVLAVSRIRPPAESDYADALATLRVRVLGGDAALAGQTIDLVLACMQDFELQASARLRVGDRLHATITPFVQSPIHRYNDQPADGTTTWQSSAWSRP